jgi:2-hydroxychromene-2-carboxylate isomerase
MAELADAVFYFHLASPDCYLAAERVLHVLPQPVEWQPVLAGAGGRPTDPDYRATIERRASELDLLPLRWPTPYPFDDEKAMLVATYAKGIGRIVAFAQAAFRQAFAGGHSLAEAEHVLVAAAACEIHPAAASQALSQRSVRERITLATARAAGVGITGLPAIRIGSRVFAGERCLDDAAAHLRARQGRLGVHTEAIAP